MNFLIFNQKIIAFFLKNGIIKKTEVFMDEKNFFKKVFDFSFKEFVTLDIMKIIYGILLVLVGIGAITSIIIGFTNGFLAGIGGIVIAIVFAFLGTIGARIWCEIVLIIFRIEANTRKK